MDSVMIDHREISINEMLCELENEIARLEHMIQDSEAQLDRLRREHAA